MPADWFTLQSPCAEPARSQGSAHSCLCRRPVCVPARWLPVAKKFERMGIKATRTRDSPGRTAQDLCRKQAMNSCVWNAMMPPHSMVLGQLAL